MAMELPPVLVERHRDPRATHELLTGLPHLASVGVEERQRRAGPGEHPHVHALSGLGQKLAEGRPAFLQTERRVEVPAGEVNV